MNGGEVNAIMESMTGIEPQAALQEIDRVDRRVRRSRWWRIAAAVIMGVFTAAFYIGLKAYPGTADDYVLPGLLLVLALLGLVALGRRVAGRDDRRQEERVVWASLGLAVVTIVLNRFLVPSGLNAWVVLTGLLPAVPFAVLAWRIAKR